MARSSAPTRHAILETGFHLFFSRGYARVSMDEIAEGAGVTKRTVYNHFDSKDALVGAVLQNQNKQTLQQFQKWIDPDARTPAEFSDSLFDKLMAWAVKPEWRGSGYSRLALELADLPGHPARKAAMVHKKAIERWLSAQLQMRGAENHEANSIAIALLLEGAMSLTLLHNDEKYIQSAKNNSRKLLQ